MPDSKAFYSEQARCWFVPIAAELITDEELLAGVSPVQVQLRDGTLCITRLPREVEVDAHEAPRDGEASR